MVLVTRLVPGRLPNLCVGPNPVNCAVVGRLTRTDDRAVPSCLEGGIAAVWASILGVTLPFTAGAVRSCAIHSFSL